MSRSIPVKKIELWKERFVLACLMGLMSIVWGTSFTNQPAFENALNNKIVMFMILSVLTLIAIGYGYYC